MSLHKATIFKGIATALITPFSNGEIDREAFADLIERQISSGIAALLVAGTTGEGATLSFSEHGELVSLAHECIRGRVPLLAGCGSNCTARACELARIASKAGADALLAVTPYYNKTSDRGIVLHFQQIAEASAAPIILYNVPSRTGFAMQMKHYRELAKHPKIVGVKEASGDLALLSALISECGEDLDVYTGNDDQIASSMRLGADGAISVCSNLIPRRTVALYRSCVSGEWKRAGSKMRSMQPLIAELFREVNPIPVKYLASVMGYCKEEYRLPLCSPAPELQKRLQAMVSECMVD